MLQSAQAHPPCSCLPLQLGLFLTGVGGVVTSIAGHGIWLFVTWLFWLAGAAALADGLGSSCSDKNLYYCSSLVSSLPGGNSSFDARVSPSDAKSNLHLHLQRALEAFSWISWILMTFMLGVVAAIGGGAFRGGRGLKDGLSEA